MSNKKLNTQNEKRDKTQENPIVDLETTFYDEMMEDLYEEYQEVKKDKNDPDRAQKLSRCRNDYGKLIRAKDTKTKRDNIEKRGYDTNAHIARKEYEKKQTPEQNEEQNEETDEAPQTLDHLHPEMEELQAALPKPDKKQDRTENKQKKLPTIIKQKPPIIEYNPNGFRPHGQMREMFKSQAPVKIAGGTYDAGKTYSCVAYIDQLARQYPGARLTFIHRSLNRIYRNIIPTYEKYLGFKPSSRADPNPTPITKYGGELPEFFEYWNGSRIYMNGLDKPQNLLSDYFDGGFVNQAELISFDRWDELTARVSERAGAAPIAFLIGDCNPSEPNHWIRQQTKDGKLEYFEMTFRDNPEIYNQKTGRLTKIGKRRVERLKDLEGLRYKRGYEGKWESAEGLVFDTFMPEIHIIDNFKIDAKWPRYLSIDWGFRNPSSCIWWARKPNDRLYAYKEIYMTKLTKPEFVKMIKENMDTSDRIQYAAVDSADQEGVEQLQRVGIRVKQPKKSRATQIDTIKERLKVDATGEPSIFFLRDRLVHPPDESLKEAYRPLEVTDEFLSCTYGENVSGTNKDDEMIKGDHHGIDSTAYLVMSFKESKTIGSGKVFQTSVQLGRR